MAKGDHIYVLLNTGCFVYQHHGIDMGDNSVVHLSSLDGARITLEDTEGRFAVQQTSLDSFSQGKAIKVLRHKDQLSPDETCEIALQQVGQAGYHLLDGNCEHFATYCATGKAISRQVELGQSTVSSIASAATKVAWAGAVAHIRNRGIGLASRIAIKPHPLQLAADGVELVTLASGCAAGLSATSSKRLASLGGQLTALGIGCAVGGPAAGVAWMTLHCATRVIADNLCQRVRQSI